MKGLLIESADDPRIPGIKARLLAARMDMISATKTTLEHHICYREQCDPKSEVELCHPRGESGLSANVYICRLGAFHICTDGDCKIYRSMPNQTCHISGIQRGQRTSSYSRGDHRTWKVAMHDDDDDEMVTETSAVQEAARKKKRKRSNDSDVPSESKQTEIAKEIIHKLLYSKIRDERNQVAIQKIKKHAEAAITTYITKMEKDRQRPFITDMVRIAAHLSTQEPLPYCAFQSRDDSYVHYLTRVIIQIARLVFKYHPLPEEDGDDIAPDEPVPKVDFHALCIAILYDMRDGITIDDSPIVPNEPFLTRNLPVIQDLTHFGYQKNSITRGHTCLMGSIAKARKRDVPIDRIIIDPHDLNARKQEVLIPLAKRSKK